MNYKIFEVKGINPQTKRPKTLNIEVINTTTPQDFVKKKKLVVEPLTITEIQFPRPTDEQLEKAKSLKIKVNKEYTLRDVAELIDRKANNDYLEPNQGLIDFATNREMLFSLCIGKKGLYDLVYDNLAPLDKLAFYCFCVFRDAYHDRHANLDTSTLKQVFYDFASANINDKIIMETINSYSGSEIKFFGKYRGQVGASNTSYAYINAYRFLKNSSAVKKYIQDSDKEHPNLVYLDINDKQYNIGCSHIVIGIIAIVLIIYLLKSLFLD